MPAKTKIKKEKGKQADRRFPDSVEKKFRLILKSISWIVAISFMLIITLPNFEFFLLDFIIKVMFYLCVFSLLFFAILEFFGTSIKKVISRISE